MQALYVLSQGHKKIKLITLMFFLGENLCFNVLFFRYMHVLFSFNLVLRCYYAMRINLNWKLIMLVLCVNLWLKNKKPPHKKLQSSIHDNPLKKEKYTPIEYEKKTTPSILLICRKITDLFKK